MGFLCSFYIQGTFTVTTEAPSKYFVKKNVFMVVKIRRWQLCSAGHC
jgi:hypothetical protein